MRAMMDVMMMMMGGGVGDVELIMLCGSRAARSAGGRCVSAAACMSMCRVRGCDVGC